MDWSCNPYTFNNSPIIIFKFFVTTSYSRVPRKTKTTNANFWARLPRMLLMVMAARMLLDWRAAAGPLVKSTSWLLLPPAVSPRFSTFGPPGWWTVGPLLQQDGMIFNTFFRFLKPTHLQYVDQKYLFTILIPKNCNFSPALGKVFIYFFIIRALKMNIVPFFYCKEQSSKINL